MLGSGQVGPHGEKDMLFKGGVAEVFQMFVLDRKLLSNI